MQWRCGPDAVALWTSSAFVEEARAWVGEQLARRGSRLTGEWKQPHVRVWSSTIRFETTEGRIWFKVNARGTAYEAALVALLGTWRSAAAPASPSRSGQASVTQRRRLSVAGDRPDRAAADLARLDFDE
jgi:hypothetical protein